MLIQSMQPVMVQENSFLQVNSDRHGAMTIKVMDVQGRLADTLMAAIEQGSQQLALNFNHLQKGQYVLNAFNGETFLKSFRFFKK
jgi:hypothetical protein